MTQTLQGALLKAGLVSKEKLKKAENEKKQAEHAERQQAQQAARKEVHHGTKKAPGRPSSPGSTNRPAPLPRREPPPVKKSLGFIEGKHHHHMRTDCEACKKSSPDVEYYQHKDKRIDTYWFCVRCADDRSIPDATRMTMQSQHAQSGLFRRNYGATKVFK